MVRGQTAKGETFEIPIRETSACISIELREEMEDSVIKMRTPTITTREKKLEMTKNTETKR